MEVLQEHQPETNTPLHTCANCGAGINFTEAKVPLCVHCRNQFLNYPIPKWIKAFGIFLLLVLVFSLYTVSKNLATGIHFKRGAMAAEKANYLTAEKEFAQVVREEPDYVEAQCRLLISAYHNHHFSIVSAAFDRIKEKNVEDNKLYREVNAALEAIPNYFPSDSLIAFSKTHHMDLDAVHEDLIRDYISKNQTDHFAVIIYVKWLMDQHRNVTADSLLNLVLDDPDAYLAFSAKAPLKREMDEPDSSYYYADKLLKLNHEDVFALSTKARTLLQEKRDKEALELATKSYSLDDRDAYSIATLALAYHFNNNIAGRDALLARAAQDSSATPVLSYVRDVISGKEKFRN